MRRIVIDMQNYLFSDAVAKALKQEDSDFEIYMSESPSKTIDLCRLFTPYALLAEVTTSAPRRLSDRMKIRNAVKVFSPNCKMVFFVDENAEMELAQQVKQAKKDGLIDQFIYGSISAAYLTALIDAL